MPKPTDKSQKATQPNKAQPLEASIDQQRLERLEQTLAVLEKRAVTAPTAAPIPAPYYHPNPDQGCGCSQSKCCCCFEIFISRIRAVDGQGPIEPGDGGWVSQYMEIFTAVTVDGITALAGSLQTAIKLSVNGGNWLNINRTIKTVTVKGTKSFPTTAEAREVGGTSIAENVLEGRPEFGSSAMSQLSLTCGAQPVPLQLRINLTGGGNSGGAIEVEVSAREICCDTC